MTNKNLGYFFTIVFISFLFGTVTGIFERHVLGAECTPIYGGGEVCPDVRIDINKKVADPSNGQFKENLFETDAKYKENNIITFEIIVQNTGNSSLNGVVVRDIFPTHISFHSGAGNINGSILTINVGNLGSGEARTFIVRGTVNNLPDGTLCGVSNTAEVRAKENGNELGDSDRVQFCLQKDILGKTTTITAPTADKLPSAGPESVILIATSLISAGSLLRKFSR